MPKYLIGFALLLAINLFAQPVLFKRLSTPPLQYSCNKIPDGSITIDGNPIEEIWQKATWTTPFQDIEGPDLQSPTYTTKAKILWDNQALYVAADLQEPHLWATLKNHDDIIFHDNDFEVFLSGNPSDLEYYEIEVNALNTIFDLLLPKPYRDLGHPNIPWNVHELSTAVQINGTINNNNDTDIGWTVEMRIPFKGLSLDQTGKTPSAGEVWRINFSRVQYDVISKETGYEKQKDPKTGKNLPEHNWVWSPQGIIDMHFPERWGYLVFQDEQIKSNFLPDIDVQMEDALWLIYYIQRENFKSTKTYLETLPDFASSLSAAFNNQDFTINLNFNQKSWNAQITHKLSGTFRSLDQSGILKRTKPLAEK
ncbi:MAG: carbohydrate-binding family 9-like protein [Bacteroidetes bacterium]|nr:carbohydrate-binding family 9-like protein [Bacteroidota bacterium]